MKDKYDINVYSRGLVERIQPYDVPHIIISVVSGEGEMARLPINSETKGVLRLHFHDIDQPKDGHIQFDEGRARQIWDFFLEHQEVGTILIHCDAGNSRSPAIAAAISKVTTGDDSEYFSRKNPNRHVFRTLLNVYYDEYIPKDGW